MLDLAWHGNGKSIALKELVLRAIGSASNRFRRQANGFTGKRRLSSSVVVCRRLLLFVVVSRRLPRNFPKIFQEWVLKWYAVVCRRLSSSVVVCCGMAPKCSKEKKENGPIFLKNQPKMVPKWTELSSQGGLGLSVGPVASLGHPWGSLGRPWASSGGPMGHPWRVLVRTVGVP